MNRKRYLLVHMDSGVYRFRCLWCAKVYAKKHCRGKCEFYVIIDTWKNEVVDKWSHKWSY